MTEGQRGQWLMALRGYDGQAAAPELAAGQRRLREVDEERVRAVGHRQAGVAVRHARARRQRCAA
jgi:hypothetical protein